MMLKTSFLFTLLIAAFSTYGQKSKITVGPEVLRSFNHNPAYWGVGGSVQADFRIKERLWLGVNSGYLKFSGEKGAVNFTNQPRHYSLIPVLGVIKYPLPIISGLYGADMFGYTFPQNVSFVKNGNKARGGFTYYFALGYEFAQHFDVSVKVGRARLNKKDNPVNVNEQNVGLKLAYLF